MVMLMHMVAVRSMPWGEDGCVNGMMMVMLLKTHATTSQPYFLFFIFSNGLCTSVCNVCIDVVNLF